MALSVSGASLCTTSKIAPSRTPVKTVLNLVAAKQQLKISPIFRRQSMSLFSIKPILKSNPRPQNTTSAVQSLFTGIVEEIGEVKQLCATADGGVDLKIRAKTVLEGVNIGDSIAVNETCLTVTNFTDQEFIEGFLPETMRKTSLIELEPVSLVDKFANFG